MMKYFLFILLIIVQFSCVGKKSNHSNTRDSNLYVVDLDHAQKVDTFNFSLFFKGAKCIKLDDNEKALVGGISKLVVYNDCLYILDAYAAKSLLVFNLDGKFIRKISQSGKGPGEYVKISDFTVNTDKNEIILLDIGQVHIYDLNGTHLKSVRLHQEGYTMTTLQYFNGLIYTDIHELQKTEDDCLLQSVNIVDGKREALFFKTNEHNKGWNEQFVSNMNYFIPKLNPPYLFRHSFMDTIFSITAEGLSPYLVFKSKDMITEQDMKLPPNTDPMDFLLKLSTKNKIYTIYSFFETSKYVHFQFFKGDEMRHAIYNKQNKTTHIVNKLQNDLVYSGDKQLNPRFIFFDQKGVYEYVSYNVLSYLLTFIHEKELKISFADQLKDLNEESNPIIFYYEFDDAE